MYNLTTSFFFQTDHMNLPGRTNYTRISNGCNTPRYNICTFLRVWGNYGWRASQNMNLLLILSYFFFFRVWNILILFLRATSYQRSLMSLMVRGFDVHHTAYIGLVLLLQLYSCSVYFRLFSGIPEGQKTMDCKTCCFITRSRNLSCQSCEYWYAGC